MNPRTITIAAASFALGFIVHLVASQTIHLATGQNAEIARHWKRVNDYNTYMRDPKNYTAHPPGLYGATIPYDPIPNLAALVAAGEINHVDLVFPLVPSNHETNFHWMQFAEERQDTIVHATANPEYVDYKPTGERPLHLQLWFKKTAKADVQRLINELEALPGPME